MTEWAKSKSTDQRLIIATWNKKHNFVFISQEKINTKEDLSTTSVPHLAGKGRHGAAAKNNLAKVSMIHWTNISASSTLK